MAPISQFRWTASRFTATAVIAAAVSVPTAAQTPAKGDLQTLTVITISMRVGSTGRETKQVSYSPPPGWYVLSHHVDCTQRSGTSSYTVTTVPQNWIWVSADSVDDSYRALMELAAQAGNAGLHAKANLEREQLLAELHKVRASQHALVVEATAGGSGFLMGGGTLELTVTADLVFIGTPECWAACDHSRAPARLGFAEGR